MKRALFVAAALAMALPAIAPAHGSDAASLNVGESGGIIMASNFGVFVMNQPEGVGDVIVLVNAHGMFDNLFGARPEGGDSRGRVDQILQVMVPIDPFEGLRPEDLVKMMPVEKMAVQREGVGEVIRPGGGSGSLTNVTFQDKILNQIEAGNYPLPPAHKFGDRNLENTRTSG